MDEQQLQQMAAQLRQPHGKEGIKTAEWMSHGNQQIIFDTLEVLNAASKDRILEIGMGNGSFVKEILLRHHSITYTGCDFSELMIQESERINAEWIVKGQAKFILSNVASLPFEDNVFNKIFTINTIYFWDDVPHILNQLKRVLQPNGKLIISFRPKHQAEKYPFTKYGFKLYSKEEVTQLLSNNSLSIEEAVETNEPDLEVNGETMKMSNVIVVSTKI